MATNFRCPDMTPIRPVPPSGPGAISGFESRCDCGLVIRSSLLTIIRADVNEHLAYHYQKSKRPAHD
jgi:hypothetical protein